MPLEPGQTLVFDGDSLTSRRRGTTFDTWPFLHMMNWQSTWADEVERLLFALRPDLGLSFRNVAVSGSTSRRLLDRFDDMLRPSEPDWVLLTCGGNDQTHGIEPEQFRQNISEYVRRVQDELHARVGFVDGWQPMPGAPRKVVDRHAARRHYYEVLQDVAGARNCLYIDAGAALARKAEAHYAASDWHTVYSDGSHFNALGSLIIAGEVLRAVGFSF